MFEGIKPGVSNIFDVNSELATLKSAGLLYEVRTEFDKHSNFYITRRPVFGSAVAKLHILFEGNGKNFEQMLHGDKPIITHAKYTSTFLDFTDEVIKGMRSD